MPKFDKTQAMGVARESYILQSGSLSPQDQTSVRKGDWDSRIAGFDNTVHALQNADNLIEAVGLQTS